MIFHDWWKELLKLADEENLLWLVGDDMESYRDMYEEEETPEDALYELKSAAIS